MPCWYSVPEISGFSSAWVSKRTSSCDTAVAGTQRSRRQTQDIVVSTRCRRLGASHPSGLARLSNRARRYLNFPRCRRRKAWQLVSASRIACTGCFSSNSMIIGRARISLSVVVFTVSFSPASASPVVLRPGSSFNHRGCKVECSTKRSTSRRVKGTIRWIRTRPRLNRRRAHFSKHGIRGFRRLSNSNTAIFYSQSLRRLVTRASLPISPREGLQPAPSFRMRSEPSGLPLCPA